MLLPHRNASASRNPSWIIHSLSHGQSHVLYMVLCVLYMVLCVLYMVLCVLYMVLCVLYMVLCVRREAVMVRCHCTEITDNITFKYMLDICWYIIYVRVWTIYTQGIYISNVLQVTTHKKPTLDFSNSIFWLYNLLKSVSVYFLFLALIHINIC